MEEKKKTAAGWVACGTDLWPVVARSYAFYFERHQFLQIVWSESCCDRKPRTPNWKRLGSSHGPLFRRHEERGGWMAGAPLAPVGWLGRRRLDRQRLDVRHTAWSCGLTVAGSGAEWAGPGSQCSILIPQPYTLNNPKTFKVKVRDENRSSPTPEPSTWIPKH